MAQQVIAVVGGTGTQGGVVVDALLAEGHFGVRVSSRNPGSDAAKALAARGVEVVKADLLDPATLGCSRERTARSSSPAVAPQPLPNGARGWGWLHELRGLGERPHEGELT